MSSKLHCYVQSLNAAERSAVEIIDSVTRESGIFNFVELIDHEKVAKLKESPIDLMYYNLLTLFCYGTYKEYLDNRQLYPVLNEQHIRKLKQLTIISLSMSSGMLDYTTIYEAIDETCQSKIEELILDLIYYNIIEGYFDQENQCFQVESSSGRDFPLSQIGDMRMKLVEWARKCDGVIERLAHEFAEANNVKAQRRLEHQQATANLEKAREEIAQVLRKEMMSGGGQSGSDKTVRSDAFGSTTPVKEQTGGQSQEQTGKKKTLLRNLKKK